MFDFLKNARYLVNELGEKKPVLITELTMEHGKVPTFEGHFLCDALTFKDYKPIKKDNIERVIFNDPATIVLWDDGTKTVVKCQPGDEYNAELGLAMCISKKYFDNKGNFNEVFKKWIPEEKPILKSNKDTHDSRLRFGTKIKILSTKNGCRGAEGKIGVVTKLRHTSGLLSEYPGYNVFVSDYAIWRINPEAKIEILEEV